MQAQTIAVILIAAAAGAAFLLLLRRRGGFPLPRAGARGRDRRKLVKMCFGDEAKADRLLQREMKQDPRIGEREACRRAIQRYRRHLG
jgi:hypothetical protein